MRLLITSVSFISLLNELKYLFTFLPSLVFFLWPTSIKNIVVTYHVYVVYFLVMCFFFLLTKLILSKPYYRRFDLSTHKLPSAAVSALFFIFFYFVQYYWNLNLITYCITSILGGLSYSDHQTAPTTSVFNVALIPVLLILSYYSIL